MSGDNVSGTRRTSTPTSTAIAMHIHTTICQVPIARIPAEIDGPIAGTSRNTAMTRDIWRAISSPSKPSRTIAIEATRGPAPPRPQTNRARIIHPSDGARIDPIAPTT